MTIGCLHGTQWFVRHLGTQLLYLLTTDQTRPVEDQLRHAIAAVADAHQDTCDLGHPGTPSATVGLVRAAEDHVDYLVLSDAIVVLDTAEGIRVVTDPRVDRAEAPFKAAILRERIGSADHARGRREMSTGQLRLRNVPGGYWVAGSNPDDAAEAISGTVARDSIRRAAVLSDGAAMLVDFGIATWPEVLDLLESEGSASLIQHVRDAEASDPQGERWPRYKTGDDATAAVCRF